MNKISYIVIESMTVPSWAAAVLDLVARNSQIVLLNCTNYPGARRNRFANALYMAIFKSCNQKVSKFINLSDVEIIDFECKGVGTALTMTKSLESRIDDSDSATVLNLCLPLLSINCSKDVFSFSFQCRSSSNYIPVGISEFGERKKVIEVALDVTNTKTQEATRLMSGKCKLFLHSYKRTVKEVSRITKVIFQATVSSSKDTNVEKSAAPVVVNQVVKFKPAMVFKYVVLSNFIHRAIYGLFFLKNWKVATVVIDEENIEDTFRGDLDFPDNRNERFVVPEPYSFIADPFYYNDTSDIVVEAMDASKGRGDIVTVNESGEWRKLMSEKHHSYPFCFCEDNVWYLIPEIAQWSSPQLYKPTDSSIEYVADIDISPRLRLTDLTIHKENDTYFIFGTSLESGNGILYLWYSDSLFSKFRKHPQSPIRISPCGSRMAGNIYRSNVGNLYRFGQDFTGEYGDGLIVFKINKLSIEEYSETKLSNIKFNSNHGPHTLNFRNRNNDVECLFDFYTEKFSLTAWMIRLRIIGNRKYSR